MIKNCTMWSQNSIIKCILGFIILSLIFSTISSYILYQNEQYAAIVNGEKISLYTVEKMYMIERTKQQQTLGKKFFEIKNNQKFIRETYNYVLSQLINNILLEQYAQKLHLTIADEEIKKIIFNAPLFQEKKIFSQKKYVNYLKSIELRHDEYINIIKKRLITEKFISHINDANFILNSEKKNIIKLLSEERVIQKAIIYVNPLIEKQTASEKEAKKYFFQHRDSFYTPEKFQISYISLNSKDFQEKYTDRDIQKWYNDHIKDYSTEAKKKYSIIQTKTKEEALLILSQLKKLDSFDEIAKKKSIDLHSSVHGGDIGWISNNIIPDIIKQAHLNKKNQVSEILPFNHSFLIIKLNDIVESHKKTLSEVYNTIKKKMTHIQALKKYNDIKNKIIEYTKKNPNQYNLLLKEINIKPIETDWFTKKSIPKIFNTIIFKKILFNKKLSQKKNQLKYHSGLINVSSHTSFLISIKNYKEKENKTFDSVKDEIILKIKKIKAIEYAKERAEKIILQLKKGNIDLFIHSHLFFHPSETISRYHQNLIVPLVFSLPHPRINKKVYTIFQDKNENIEILSFSKTRYKSFSPEEEKIIIKYLENNNTENIFYAILKNLHERAKIIYKKIDDISI